jgi:GWxTD domain-containing protein
MNLTRPWKPTVLGLLLVALSLSLAAAQVAPRKEIPPAYRKWLNEDVVWIITDEERADFKKLTTDEQGDEFVAAFWERGNPNPSSAENKFREEHYRRIAYANLHFGSGIPGWKNDRGRIYIMYGPPDSIESNPGFSPPSEVWHYACLKGIGRNVVLDFIDNCRCGEYALTKGDVDSVPRIFNQMNPPYGTLDFTYKSNTCP